MERILDEDAGAGMKPVELQPEIRPNIDCRTEVMEGDSRMRHDSLSYPPFSRKSGNGIHPPHQYPSVLYHKSFRVSNWMAGTKMIGCGGADTR